MALSIETFSNVTGGHSLFKALGHPLCAPLASALLSEIEAAGPVAVYDPLDHAVSFAALHDLERLDIADVFVQDSDAIGATRLGSPARAVLDLPATSAATVLVAAFDAERLIDQVRHLLPDGVAVTSLDRLRLPDDMLTNRRRYLDPLNFATNLALLRDDGGDHTRLVTANYWSGYGAGEVSLWCCLIDAHGETLATWRDPMLGGLASVVVDSRDVRRRFALGPFTGTLFVHVIGAAGHDVVKYALDTFGDDDSVLSCTHDANAWPSALYAGVPAPAPGERVLLWVQNSHPCEIPAGAVGLNRMGVDSVAWHDRAIPPFGTVAIDVATLLPDVAWPDQIEVQAGKHFVRPRYEVVHDSGRRRIAHANVERTDLAPDPRLAELEPLLGKGFLLPAPILPRSRWESVVLPTPMSTAQADLPVKLLVYDPSGVEIARHEFGRLPRGHDAALELETLLGGLPANGFEYGHMELIYDFEAHGVADSWLHALFRYRDRHNGHAADTSFGAHIFNTALVYRNEPQSYAGRPPGLSTRLFLRLGHEGADTLCHLIYPASTPWHPTSDTQLMLFDALGEPVAEREARIPCSGSLLWRASETFDASERTAAGAGAYVLIRDTTCRLFGYHGLDRDGAAFSLDHMFGF